MKCLQGQGFIIEWVSTHKRNNIRKKNSSNSMKKQQKKVYSEQQLQQELIKCFNVSLQVTLALTYV
ncbi:hypothetical protein pb186bvf_005358 [Paramecium bursaria]